MAHKPTITIGIPAYNESLNIENVVRDLLRQKTRNVRIVNIMVVSDASTDGTETVVSGIKDVRVHVLTNKRRIGQMKSQNRIIRKCKSDMLVLVNADIRISDNTFIEKITYPIRSGVADLTSCNVRPVFPTGIFERILHVSTKMKQYLYERYNNGRNIYTCHGRARAFSKKLYTRLRFNNTIAEDAYSYLFCLTKGLVYQYVPTTSVYYRLPTSFRDHLRQSVRFMQSREQLSASFSSLIVENEYHIPSAITLEMMERYFRSNPLSVLSYMILFICMNIISRVRSIQKTTWDVSTTSKLVTQYAYET